MSRSMFQTLGTLLLALSMTASRTIAGGCADWRIGPMTEDSSAVNGAYGRVAAATSWDPDGFGPLQPMLVVAGKFTSIEGVPVTNIAARDPITGVWQPMGAAFNDWILALTVFNGQLIAGGYFTQIGAQPRAYAARWDGVTWQDMGPGFNREVLTFAIRSGQLFAGGRFTGHVARWDNTQWTVIPNGPSGFVDALTVHDGYLVATGYFPYCGNFPNPVEVNGVARWNGSTWSALGTGADNTHGGVAATVYNNELVVGGFFGAVGGVSANGIAKWNGSSWSPLGSGVSGGITFSSVSALTVYNGKLIAGGYFLMAGGQPAGYVASWNGVSWSPLGLGLADSDGWDYSAADALTVYNGELVAGGSFDRAGGQVANNLARWNGASWFAYGGVTLNSVNAFVNYGSRLVSGGDFQQLSAANSAMRNIVAWDGIGLSKFGSGMNAPVYSLCSITYPGVGGDLELIAGGSFTTAGGAAANRIARWIEDPVTGFPAPQWEAMGNGFNGSVSAITRFNGRTIAGGYFTTSGNGATTLNRIARWNETSDTWEAMGTGHNGAVAALRAYTVSSQLVRVVAGGYFPGGVSAWTETTQVPSTPVWTTLGTGFNGAALALEHHGGSLYAGGEFTFAGATAVNRIARFDTVPNPDVWVPVGNGIGFNGSVTALRSHNGMLYASGNFTSVDGIPANRLAVWNGTVWQEVQGGADNSVLALGIYHDELHVGGTFDTVRNGVIASKSWAKYFITGMPWIYDQPDNASVTCNQHAFFYSHAAYGYGGLGFEWRKNGVPLANGPTGTGSHILNRGPLLDILYPSTADEGVYELALSSDGCGTVISNSATLDVIDNCQPCPADANHDRMVNVADLLLIITNWGACPPPPPIYTYAPPCVADLNADGQINVADLLRVITGWGACP